MGKRDKDPKDYKPMTFMDLMNGACVVLFFMWVLGYF